MDKRLLQRVRAVLAYAPKTTVTNTAVDSVVIDRLGSNGALARSALLLISNLAATVGTVTITPTLFDGATSSPATAVTLKTALPTHDCVADSVEAYQLDLEGFNRYFKVTFTPVPGSSGVSVFSASVVLGDMDIVPAATVPVVYAKA